MTALIGSPRFGRRRPPSFRSQPHSRQNPPRRARLASPSFGGHSHSRQNPLRHNTTHHTTPQHSTAQHSTAQHSTAQHSRAQQSTAEHSTAQHSTAQRSAAQRSTAQHSTAQPSTAQHSTAQHSTAQHSTAQHRTALERQDPQLRNLDNSCCETSTASKIALCSGNWTASFQKQGCGRSLRAAKLNPAALRQESQGPSRIREASKACQSQASKRFQLGPGVVGARQRACRRLGVWNDVFA